MDYSSAGRQVSSWHLYWKLALMAVCTLLMCSNPGAGGSAQLGVGGLRRRHHRRQVNSGHRFFEFEPLNSTVVPLPEFLHTKTNVTVREGDMATLPCVVRNLGTKQVAWRRVDGQDEFLTVGTFTWAREKNIQVDHKLEDGQVSQWNLIIKGVMKDDEGTYQCQVTEKTPMRSHIYLIVTPRPIAKPAVVLSGKEYVDRDEPIRLLCNATGPKIPEDIDWFKDGVKLDTRNTKHPNIVITKYMSLEDQAFISELVIEHSDSDNSGTYICRSSDREVDSIKVHVLVADTTNVKRGAHELHSVNAATGSNSATSVDVLLFFILVVSLVWWR